MQILPRAITYTNIFLYSAVLDTSQVLEVVKNAEKDIVLLISSNLMSIFSPNVGHQEKIISVRTYMHVSAVSPFVSMPVCATVSFVLVRLLVFLFFFSL